MAPDKNDLEQRLQELTSALAEELISLTPEFMSEIQFEIVSTDDGGADIGLLENYPEVRNVELSPLVYELCSKYLSLVKQYPGWKRSYFAFRENQGQWKTTVDFEYNS